MEELASASKPVFSIADEGRALRNLMWMWWITAVTYNAVAIPVIWDPAQHSFLVRDSTWTPPHLMIFGPFFALMMFEAIVFQFYALKKAQPYIRGDIPITLWVFPITVFGFTLGSMLTNEIGHIFLFREEFFSMPTHWNFVLTFMFIYAVGVPEVVRVLSRLGQLEAKAKQLGATLGLMFFFLQRNLVIQLFYVGMNNYPFNFVQLPSYLLPAMATDFTLVLFGLRKHMGLYVLISCFLAGVLVVPGHFLFLNVPFLLTNVVYPDPLNTATNHVMPMWSVIRMVIPKAPIPAYIAEQFTWPLPYRSFYDPYIIMTGFMGIMGVVWSGFTYIFLKAIFYAIGKTTRHFVEPAGA